MTRLIAEYVNLLSRTFLVTKMSKCFTDGLDFPPILKVFQNALEG